ncbi:MAG TPA: S41 family peptidase [Solirubrobacterales bacterium]|nr:S41 family peptidase [Solirubrobacterales bacterium]
MSPARMAALAAALVAVLAAGLWLGGHPAKLPSPLRDVFVDESAGLTAEATELIEDNYFREVDESELIDSSLSGMARGLRRRFHDRFSEYFPPALLERFNEAIEGKFSGIGLTVLKVDTGLRVERVFKGSPAEKAGIETGDVIVSVEGQDISDISSTKSTELIKGPEGTDVRIGVRKQGKGEVESLTLTRAQIAVPVVASTVLESGGRKFGYVRLASFSEGSHAYMRRAVERVRRQGAEGLILDLRENGGGLLEEAVHNASIFLPKGTVVVSTKSRTQGDAVYDALGDSLPPQPIVVLIDRNTASAAEILTAALNEKAGAEVVGTRSYGKGVFQQEVALSNGGALKLTIGEYFTPNGENLAGHGIHPDVFVRDDPKTKPDEARRRALQVLAAEKGSG